ncbi:hypothetical protein BJ912DRAFT_1000719, partial [Pholiota molesta]
MEMAYESMMADIWGMPDAAISSASMSLPSWTPHTVVPPTGYIGDETHRLPDPDAQSIASDAWLPLPELMGRANASYSPPSSSDGMSPSSTHMWNHLDPIPESNGSTSSLPSSASPPAPAPSSESSSSHPTDRASAPMGTVSEATILWLVRNVPPSRVSDLLHPALLLRIPETQLAILVLRELWGRHQVTADEVNGFETMVYNESMDERRRGRRERKRRRRSQ